MLQAWTEVCHQFFCGWKVQNVKFTEECVTCTVKHVLLKSVYKCTKLFKKSRVEIAFRMKTGHTMPNSPGMVDSVNSLIFLDRRVTVEDIFEQQGISKSTAYSIVHDDLAFLKVSCCWVLKMLILEHKSIMLQQEHWKPSVSTISSYMHLIIQIWSPLISTCLNFSKNFYMNKILKQ